MDSAVSAAIARRDGYEILGLHFDYNQRTQSRERQCFYDICADLGAKSFVFDASFIASIGGSALTDLSLEVPKNREFSTCFESVAKNPNKVLCASDESTLISDKIAARNAFASQMSQSQMNNFIKSSFDESELPITYVPFRNGIFLSIAVALAQKEGCDAVFLGLVEEDGSGYPDCTADFLAKMTEAIQSGTGTKIKLIAPLIAKNKGEIVKLGTELGVDFSHTYSCYESEDKPCGACDSCKLRARGFALAGIKDPVA